MPTQARHPGLPESRYARLVQRYLRARHRVAVIGSRFAHIVSKSGWPTIRSLFISLPMSVERRRTFLARADADGWALSSVAPCYPPVPGSMDDEEWELFHEMSERLTAGQRGCFLSHRRAWKEALSGPSDLTVVLEDDAVPLYRRFPRLPRLPKNLDVLYLHHFAQYLPGGAELAKGFCFGLPINFFCRPFEIHPMDVVLASHCGRLRRAAMPACAYAVTKSGAAKLLAIFDEVGNHFQWDSIMLRHAVGSAVFEQMIPHVRAAGSTFYQGQRQENAAAKVASISLNAYAIYPPLVLHDYEAPSVKFEVGDPALE